MAEPPYTIDALEPQNSIGFLVKHCGVLMTRIAERRFAAEPLSFTQWFVLSTLSRFEHLSPTLLSEEAGYDAGALTRLVDTLEAGGLVGRTRSKRDRRAVEIALTCKGRERLQDGRRLAVDLLNELAEPYSRREFESLLRLLQRLLQRLEESDALQQAVARRSASASAK